MKDDIYYMRQAMQMAEKASESGEVPVGAVIVLSDGQVFAAHNAPISMNDPSAHAEMRAMRAACAAVGNYRLPGARLYVTLEPCIMCAGAIIHARIGQLIYGASEPKTGGVESLYQLLTDPRLNHQVTLSRGVLADECSAQLRLFFRQRRLAAKNVQQS